MPDNFVTMFHPVTKGKADVHVDAFNQVYKHKGWRLMDDSVTELQSLPKTLLAEMVADTGADPEDLTKNELVDVLTEKGIN